MKQTFKLIIFFVLSFLVKNVKAQYGNGVNGNVTINSPNTIVNQYYQVQSVSTNYIDLQFNTFLNAGKYLLIQTTGTNAGNWEVIEIVSSGNGINHITNQINTTFSSGNIQLISFPQYDNLTINSGGVITCPAYNATTGTGGVVFFQVQNNFTIDNGQIDVSGKGFPANAAGTGAAGGIGGAGGTGGTIGAHGAIASVPLTGIGYGGNGGYANNNAALGGVANVPTYLGCAATASNASNNSTTPPTLLMGACGYSGNGGNSGQGAGGGGGGAGTTTCNNGDNGGAGGNGGNGGIGGNGGGIIMIHAKNVSYTGSNLFVANGTNGGSATNGSDGGNGGNGGNGCGTVCSSAGGGGGGTGADGGNGGNGGNGAAAGILYIKKASGTNLNSQHYQLNGGVGGNGGNGGVKGLHGANAPLLGSTNCPPPPFIINGVTYTCYLGEVLNDLSLIGTNAYTTTNISSHEVEYSYNGATVTINYFASGNAMIYTSNGYYIYITNNTSSLSIQNILTQILAGNSSITWSNNTTGFITTTTGTAEGLCGTQRATADDGNDGLPGTSGNAGTGTTPFEQTVTCNDITLSEMQFVYACNAFDIQALIDNAVNQFNAQSTEPALNAQITGGNGFNSLIVTATTASGCTLTMNYSIMEFDNNVQVSLLNVSNASCGTSDGSATFNITDYGHIQSSGGFNYQLVNATGSIVQSGFSSTIPFVATNLSAGNYSFYVANCMGQYIAYDVCTITENCCTNTASTTNLSICNSQLPYTWNGLTFTSAGTQTAHLTNAAGCDSAATLDLVTLSNAIPTQYAIKFDPTCFNNDGQVYLFFYNSIFNPTTNFIVENSITHTFITSGVANGNNPTLIQNLSAGTYDVFAQNCNGAYTLTAQFTLTAINLNCCNIQITGNNEICQNSTSQYSTNIANGTWSSSDINIATVSSNGLVTGIAAGNCYIFYSISQNGLMCSDTIKLTVKPNSSSITTISICDNQLPYTWNGLTFTSAGTQTAHLTNAAGCDSAATLDLTVNLPTTSTASYELCSSQFPFYYNGESFDKCGEYTVIIPNSVGCDSVITLSLICATKYEDIYETVCYKILPYVWNGISITTAGTYSYQTTSVGGCDSIVTLYLIVDYPTSSTTNINACNSYTWNGTTYTQSGTYVFVTTNAAHCGDSIATLNLTINQPSSSTTKITICNSSYTWNNNTYTASGIYTVTLINSVGCDSIATLKLTLGDHSSSNTYVTICDNAAPYIWNGQSCNASGLYTYTTINSVGCDSIAKLYLTINATSKSFTYITHCGSSFNWNGNTYNATGNYVVHFTNSVGCDSAAILILTLAAPTSSTTIVSGCLAASSFTMGTIALPYIWNGNSYNTSGSYTVHLTNAAGCDSAATLILNILQPTTSTTNLTICSNQLPYTWNGLTFTSAGTQTAHLTNAAGCDSAATLILIVNTPTTSTTNLTICNNQLPYTWNGLTFTSAGTQTAHLTNVAGCDSAATLILTTSTVSIGSKTIASVCQNNLPYSWMGTNYYTAGTYKVFHPSTGSTCSYEDTLILSVKDTSWMHFLQNICSSQLPYTWGLQVITTAGTYIQTFTKQNGCDSLVYLTIQIENCSSLPIVGNKVICLNSSNQTQLSNVNVGGYWVSSNSSIATVSNTGLVTAYNQGIVTIYYVYTVGSIQYVLSTIVTITTVPVFTINGPSSICVGDRPQFTTLPAQTGGTWSSLYTIRATINATTGEAQGINAGSTVIKYSLPTTCGPVSVVFATKPLVVNAKPPVPNIGYASGYPNPRSCAGGLYKVGAVFGLIGYPSGGTWSATPANVVTINNLGVVTVTGVGTGSITYTYTNANGCSNSKTLTGTTMACRPATLLNTEIASIGYSLYPNPASNVVHVKVSDLIGVNTVTITDILGRKIKQQNISIGDNLIDISHLGKGTYLLTIGTTDKQFVEKLVVQ